MLLILSENTDVFFNLAAEDHLLHHSTEDILMLWRSNNAVVCGKHQNICAEVNYAFCKENKIAIARRLSGGGSVFHDLGNINFTFIQNIPDGLENAVNYRRFLEPVRIALSSMGVETSYSDRNDLLLNGKKISGNAEHVLQKKRRVLHHGTLLFQSDLDSLGKALRSTAVYRDKAVRSIRSEVTNIFDHQPRISGAEDFLQRLYEHFLSQNHTYRYVLNSSERQTIEKLRAEKYRTDDWIIGYSPSYEMEKEVVLGDKNYLLLLKTNNGIISELSIQSEGGSKEFLSASASVIGKKLNAETAEIFAQNLGTENTAEDLKFILF